MPFLSDLDVKILRGGDRVLLRPLAYATLPYTDHNLITVPSGFVTDFASVPDWALSLVNGDDLEAPATLHDYLYRNHIGTRSQADKILWDSMGDVGVSMWKKVLVYAAVRIAGWASWR